MMQVNVETHKVYAFGLKKLRRRKRSECEQAVWIGRFSFGDQFVNESLNAGNAAPTHDVSRNLVNHAMGEYRGMAFRCADRPANGPARFCLGVFGVQKAKVFRPGNIYEHS